LEKKNIMRSPEEKERIVLESFENGCQKTARKYEINRCVLKRWRRRCNDSGLSGLISRTGKSINSSKGNPLINYQNKKKLSREEQLEFENLKLKIEVARLKKGYRVKGAGTKKECVTIKDANTKS